MRASWFPKRIIDEYQRRLARRLSWSKYHRATSLKS